MAVEEQPTPEVFKRPQHPHDIGDADLARARSEVPRPDLLDELVAAGRAVFGFFPDHYPHTLNYAWLLERLEPVRPGARVLDVGAGVSPLPIVLSRRGILVETVDNSWMVRTMPVRPDWNEWGFFDYSIVDERVISYHRDVLEHVPTQPYDRVYSVGSLAHMTGVERQQTVGLLAQWLEPGGRLLLAIDLLPKSDFLWNRSWGIEVEPPIDHGTVDDVLASIERQRLRVTERTIRRTVHASRTDLLFVEAVAQT